MLIELKISRKKIEENIKKIQKINKNIIYVLKDDAYGLGIENILPILIENNCYYFAVAYIEEALKIKKIVSKKYFNKLDKIQIITLNYIETKDIKKILDNEIEITIFSLQQLESYIEVLLKNKKTIQNDKKIKIHLKVNTGMNRLGFDEDEIDILVEKLYKVKENIDFEIISVYSHISNAEDSENTILQIEKYEKILKKLNKYSVKYKNRHIQASPLLFEYSSKYNYDFARIGMAIYGMEPLSKNIGLENTVSLTSKVISIRKVLKGEKISYGTNTIKKDTKIAIIPIGYAHGLQKQIENSCPYVLIKGEKAYIIGEICMDMILVDITNIKNIRIGSKATIIGEDKNKKITLQKMSRWANTIQDDILTNFSKTIKIKVVK